MSDNIEQEYKQVQSNLKQVGDDLKTYAEQSEKELKANAALSQETKAAVDKLLTTQGELNGRLQAAEQLIVNLDTNGGTPAPQTLGERVLASEGFEANANSLATAKGSFSIPVQAAITTSQGVGGGNGGYEVDPMRVPGIVSLPDRRLTVRDLLNFGRTTSNSVEYVRESGFSNNANTVAENPNNTKPQSEIDFELQNAPVTTIAHWIQASRQVLSDVPMMLSHIDGRLMYGLKLKEETQLLKGSGVGVNIDGLYTQAQDYSNPGVVVQNETLIDRLRLAMLQVQLAEYSSEGIVLNPIDWAKIELNKDTQNRYLFANPQGVAGPVLWGLPVVATQSMDQNEFLTGAFRMGAQGWDREDATVTVSTEDRNNFIKNMVTILCEERIGLTVYRPEAFVKGSLVDVPVEPTP